MIELSQIPVSSKLKDLRGQINTMANEINTDQMAIGQCVGVSVELTNKGMTAGTIKASKINNNLYALCMPESNGLFVVNFFGSISTVDHTSVVTGDIDLINIDIAAIKLPSRDDYISTFVPPSHLGLNPFTWDYSGVSQPDSMHIGPTIAGRLGYSRNGVNDDFLLTGKDYTLQQGATGCNIYFL